MPRATKIVATLGPASSDPAVLERLLRAGVDVVRLNFSHGSAAGPYRPGGAGARHRAAHRQAGGTDGRPAGPEDPRRQVRRGQRDAGQRRGLRARCLARGTRRHRRGRPRLQGTAARRQAGRQPAAQRRADRAHRVGGARRAGAHRGQAGRRAVQQQGHQQGRRRPDRAGTHRQGHGRHQDGDEPSSATTWQSVSRRAPPTWKWRGNWPTWPASRSATNRR